MIQQNPTPIQLPASIRLAAQFLLGNLAAALVVAACISVHFPLPLALLLGAGLGFIVTLPIQEALRRLGSALAGGSGELVPDHHIRVLGELVTRVNSLIARNRELESIREGLVYQTGEAAAQAERNRLARELHDSIKQQLFSISMSAAAAEARWISDPAKAKEALTDVRRSVQEAMVEMNALLQQLSPAPLEKVGLVQALKDQCEALGYRAGAEMSAEFGELPPDDRLPAGTPESLFRIAQEALSNIARHARAKRVRLYLGQMETDDLRLEIEDDGQGFEVSTARGMGVSNIRQRVAACDGRVEIESAIGKGTKIVVSIPLTQPAESREVVVYKVDHTLNKVFLTGLIGGLALIAILVYPFYFVLPGQIVSEWGEGSAFIGVLLEGLAALAAAATGYAAARWAKATTRFEGAGFGALAGGVAASIMYFGLGAATAAVVSGAALLQHGVAPAADEAGMIYLLVRANSGIIWGTYTLGWAALLAGVGLGAIGGAFAPATVNADRSWLRLSALNILSVSALSSALALVVAFGGYALLEPAMYEALARTHLAVTWWPPLSITFLWPVGAPMLLHIEILLAVYITLRAESRIAANDAIGQGRLLNVPTSAFGAALVAIGLPILLQVEAGWLRAGTNYSAASTSLGIVTFGSMVSFVISLLFCAAGVSAWRRIRALGLATQFNKSGLLRNLLGVMSIATLVISLTLLINAITSFTVQNFLLAFVGLLVAGFLNSAGWEMMKRFSDDRAFRLLTPIIIPQGLSSIAGAAFGIALPILAITPAALGILMIVVTLIAPLASFEPGASPIMNMTLTDIVRNVYVVNAQVLLGILVVASASAGTGMLIYWGMVNTVMKRAAGNESGRPGRVGDGAGDRGRAEGT